MFKSKQGFTMVEILVVLILVAVGIGLFNVIFVNNWLAYEERIARVNLLNEANQLIDELSFNARNSKTASINVDENNKSVSFTFADDAGTQVVYSLSNDGTAKVTQDQKTKTISNLVDFANSSFERDGKNYRTHLTLKDQVIGQRWISVTVDSEVLLRN